MISGFIKPFPVVLSLMLLVLNCEGLYEPDDFEPLDPGKLLIESELNYAGNMSISLKGLAWSQDGKQVFFGWRQYGELVHYVQRINVENDSVEPRPQRFDFSPELSSSPMGTYSICRDNSGPQRRLYLTKAPDYAGFIYTDSCASCGWLGPPIWSSDERYMAFCSSADSITVRDLDIGERMYTFQVQYGSEPLAFSPDNTKLLVAYDNYQTDLFDISIVDLASFISTPLTSLDGTRYGGEIWEDVQAIWDEDQIKVLYQMNYPTFAIGEYSSLDSTSRMLIPPELGGWGIRVFWTLYRASKTIAVVDEDRPGYYGIYLFNMETEEVTRIAHAPGGVYYLAFNPDGSAIAYVIMIPRGSLSGLQKFGGSIYYLEIEQ